MDTTFMPGGGGVQVMERLPVTHLRWPAGVGRGGQGRAAETGAEEARLGLSILQRVVRTALDIHKAGLHHCDLSPTANMLSAWPCAEEPLQYVSASAPSSSQTLRPTPGGREGRWAGDAVGVLDWADAVEMEEGAESEPCFGATRDFRNASRADSYLSRSPVGAFVAEVGRGMGRTRVTLPFRRFLARDPHWLACTARTEGLLHRTGCSMSVYRVALEGCLASIVQSLERVPS
mmetsp:Transcript_10550/g.29566  ORF Transcript_10550/g.29566 Transcript_10550/m.29566 type:complete len:233 (-) Transcript_10550:1611-2309(-)